MAKLSDHLKKILSCLAHQDAGDYLPMHDKMRSLGFDTEVIQKAPVTHRKTVLPPTTHRIALISDGRGAGAPLDYVVDACLRQHAKIDLLIHGSADASDVTVMENKILAAGIEYHPIQLGEAVIKDILNYVSNHPALIFFVAVADDEVAKILMEEVIPKRGSRIRVPLVLIEDRPGNPAQTLSVA